VRTVWATDTVVVLRSPGHGSSTSEKTGSWLANWVRHSSAIVVADVARLTPLGHPTINLDGRYRTTSRPPTTGLRPLRTDLLRILYRSSSQAYEWRKCTAKISGEKNVRRWHTSDVTSRPPADESGLEAEYGLIRQWMTAILCAAEDPERVKGWGRRAIAVRLVLLALGQAAMVSSSSTIEFGTRNLALHSALSHRTVSRVLRILRDEPDPLIDLVSPRRMARADRYGA